MQYLLVFLAGLGAGFVNVLAGGGSMITLPAMTFLGLELNVANGTNRIGILLQNLVASRKFSKGKMLDWKRAIFLAVPTTAGATLGSLTAVQMDTSVLKTVVGGIFIVMSVFILWKPKVWTQQRQVKRKNWLSVLVFFGIGVYGGFIQAGVGFFLISALVLLEGYDLVRTNAIKVFIVLCYTSVSLLIFALNGQINILVGLALAAGAMLGGYLGAKTAIQKGANFIRYILFAMVVVSAVNYLFFS
ncbi:MAG TPA: sulfite exporter TauE/SafE family protein [Thermotogota bacterium]|nr:sulfite exporter TauE/SafE family protein [Thermotogota bacterium]